MFASYEITGIISFNPFKTVQSRYNFYCPFTAIYTGYEIFPQGHIAEWRQDLTPKSVPFRAKV